MVYINKGYDYVPGKEQVLPVAVCVYVYV